MTSEESATNFRSHQWKTSGPQGSPADPGDRVVFCDDCGCENQGDPAEFPQLEYPACDRVDA